MKHGRLLSLTHPEPDLFQLRPWSTTTGDSAVEMFMMKKDTMVTFVEMKGR